jgi:hypothetical protein
MGIRRNMQSQCVCVCVCTARVLGQGVGVAPWVSSSTYKHAGTITTLHKANEGMQWNSIARQGGATACCTPCVSCVSAAASTLHGQRRNGELLKLYARFYVTANKTWSIVQ